MILTTLELGWVGIFYSRIYKSRKVISYDGGWISLYPQIRLKDINMRMLRDLAFAAYYNARQFVLSGLKLWFWLQERSLSIGKKELVNDEDILLLLETLDVFDNMDLYSTCDLQPFAQIKPPPPFFPSI